MNQLTDWFVHKLSPIQYDLVAGLESRGFIFAPLIGYRSNRGFIPIRKAGKLPGEKFTVTYNLEYKKGEQIELQNDAIIPGQRVVIVDDLIGQLLICQQFLKATGGTACAARELVEKAGGIVAAYLFVIELKALKGRDNFVKDVPVIVAFAE